MSPFRGRPIDVERLEISDEEKHANNDMGFHFFVDCCRLSSSGVVVYSDDDTQINIWKKKIRVNLSFVSI